MKFLVDAQLPARLAKLLNELGHDATHSSELPNGNRTTDTEISETADAEGRVVVTKDRDFRDSHLLQGTPHRVLAVLTGNISNNDLLALFETNIQRLVNALEGARFVELGPDILVVHRDAADESEDEGI